MKSRRIEFIQPIIEDKTASQVNFDCSRKDGGPVISEIDSRFTKLSLRLVEGQNFFFKDSAVISCPLKALDRFN